MFNLEKVIQELKELDEGIPMKRDFPNDELILNYENLLGTNFTGDYKYFLKNASIFYVNTLEPFMLFTANKNGGRLDLLTGTKEAWGMGVPKDWLPICEDNGDYYCLLEDGTVRYWDHDGSTDEKWESLAHWIKDVWIDEN